MAPWAIRGVTLSGPEAFCHQLLFSPTRLVSRSVASIPGSSGAVSSRRDRLAPPLALGGFALPGQWPARRTESRSPLSLLSRAVLLQDRVQRVATIACFAVGAKVARIMPTAEYFRKLYIRLSGRIRNRFTRPRDSTDARHRVPCNVGRWRDVSVKPVRF